MQTYSTKSTSDYQSRRQLKLAFKKDYTHSLYLALGKRYRQHESQWIALSLLSVCEQIRLCLVCVHPALHLHADGVRGSTCVCACVYSHACEPSRTYYQVLLIAWLPACLFALPCLGCMLLVRVDRCEWKKASPKVCFTEKKLFTCKLQRTLNVRAVVCRVHEFLYCAQLLYVSPSTD